MRRALGRTFAALTAAVVAGAGVAAAEPSADPNNAPQWGHGPLGFMFPPTVQGPIHREFASFGPHPVAMSQTLTPCSGLYADILATAVGLAGGRDEHSVDCTSSFPYGPDAPVDVLYVYPADLDRSEPAPLAVFLPGVTDNPGGYELIAKLWASRGFAVAIGYNFINSLPTDHIWVTQAAIGEAARVDSPLHDRIDFGRTIVGGHSGGAGATTWAASIMPGLAPEIDPRLRIIGALNVATGGNGPIGAGVTVPSLDILGTLDPTVITGLMMYATIFQAPAYTATIVNGAHPAMKDGLPDNPVAGLSVAWLEHLAGGNPAADGVFVGPDWSLARDPAYTSVQRNALADQVQ